jgi:hypothetical protein
MTDPLNTVGIVSVSNYIGALTTSLFGFGSFGLMGGIIGAVLVLMLTAPEVPPESRKVVFTKVFTSTFVGALAGTLVAHVVVHFFPFMATESSTIIVLSSIVLSAVGWRLVIVASRLVLAYMPKLAALLPVKPTDGGAP